jgi:acid phosphatase type 7
MAQAPLESSGIDESHSHRHVPEVHRRSSIQHRRANSGMVRYPQQSSWVAYIVTSLALLAAFVAPGVYPRPAAQSSVTLVRGPYLQQVGATRGIVVWATREPGPATVEYWTGAGAHIAVTATSIFRSSSTTGIASYYQHEAVLTGLSASTAYNYDLRVAGLDCTPGVVDQFRTPPAPGTGTIRLVTFGDSGKGSTAQGQIASLLDREAFDVVVHNGDVAYSDGTYAQFDAYFFPYYRNWLRRVPVFPSIGNHDDRSASATPYRRFFVLPPDGASAAYPNNAERFYSFDYGPVHFVALDTEAAFLSTARRQEQIAWLIDDLERSQHLPWRVVFFHRPPYSSGAEHGSDLTIRQAFTPIFEQYNVQLVLTGHEHSYERTVPWRASTDTSRQAVTYVISGGAGASLYPVGRNAWTAHSRSAYNYVRASFSPTELTLEAVMPSGTGSSVFDRFTLVRADQEDDVAVPTVAFDSPSSGAVWSGTQIMAASASDDIRVEKVDLLVDGQLKKNDITVPYSVSVDTRTLTNGSHTLQAIAYDIDGKRKSVTRSVTVSNPQ